MNKDQISSIHIEGFKSIKSCHVKMGMINVLIGGNGAGKSNFISVFKLLQDVIEKNLRLSVGQSGGANALLYNGRKVTERMEITFHFGNNGYKLTLMPTDEDSFVFEDERFLYYPEQYDTLYPKSLGTGHEESRWEEGSGTRYDGYILPILSKQKWRLYHFHDTSKSARVKQTCDLANNAELLYDAGNLAAFLYRLKNEYNKNYMSIIRSVQMAAPFFEDFYLEPTANGENISLRWKQKGSYDVFNANQLSDGTIRFICLSALLLQPSKLQPESIVIDEPELGLHPFAITALAEIIQSVSQRKQVLLSTQSVELLNEFMIDDIIVVDRNEDGTKFRRLDENALHEWLETDYSLGDLWKKNLLGGRFSR